MGGFVDCHVMPLPPVCCVFILLFSYNVGSPTFAPSCTERIDHLSRGCRNLVLSCSIYLLLLSSYTHL